MARSDSAELLRLSPFRTPRIIHVRRKFAAAIIRSTGYPAAFAADDAQSAERGAWNEDHRT